jgi:hypothetical protein
MKADNFLDKQRHLAIDNGQSEPGSAIILSMTGRGLIRVTLNHRYERRRYAFLR